MHANNAEFNSASLIFFICERCFSIDYLLFEATAFRNELTSWEVPSWLKLFDGIFIQIQNNNYYYGQKFMYI